MIAFAIADGVMPSNEGRGYVVRRVLRRACRFGRVLNIQSAFLYELVDILVQILGEAFPELIDKKEHIVKVIKAEEISFGKTLDRGLIIIEDLIENLKKGDILKGEDVFMLYDTYGFPIDLTELILRERGYNIDVKGYEKCMNTQKNTARSHQQFKNSSLSTDWKIISKQIKSKFIGYDKNKCFSEVVKYRIIDNNIEVVCKETPFYAESGGQIGDTGIIKSEQITLMVNNTYKSGDDICHLCSIKSGDFSLIDKNNQVELIINDARRIKIRSNHTATHLLHKALKIELGKHVQQAGSLVTDEKLRFDLTHYEQISQDSISTIESIVNDIIIKNDKLLINEQNFDEAKKNGAEALFGEKYDDIVRVVDINNFSKELCGGTHVNRTGDIGSFKIISESSLASGIRRIEAVTGNLALDIANKNYNLINYIKTKLKCNEEDIKDKIDDLSNSIKENIRLLKEIEIYKINILLSNKNQFIKINNYNVLTIKIKESFDSKAIIDSFLNKYKSNSICLIGLDIEKPMVIFCGTQDVAKKNNFGNIIKEYSQKNSGGGGGPKHFGTSGFKNKKDFLAVYDLLLKQINLME